MSIVLRRTCGNAAIIALLVLIGLRFESGTSGQILQLRADLLAGAPPALGAPQPLSPSALQRGVMIDGSQAQPNPWGLALNAVPFGGAGADSRYFSDID